MSCDLRYDPIFGLWACIAEHRQTRPFEFQQLTQRRSGIDCPFCRGNESVTPTAISQWSANGILENDSAEWLIRVLPNKYPAFASPISVQHPPLSGQRTGETGPTSPADLVASDHHFQEVIVVSPRHVASLSGLVDDELFTSFRAFQVRVASHTARPAVQHVCLFMNCRALAGASIEHSHFQLISSPVCTEQVRQRVDRMNHIADGDEDTTWQTLLQWEFDQAVRLIQQSESFVVFCPFASRFSNQIRIALKPGQHAHHSFHDLPPQPLRELASLCRHWIDGIERCLDNPAYNLVFHLPPSDIASSVNPQTTWFVDLVPRFPQAAGFEIATDCWVNPVSPERAAEQFRRFGESG